MIFRGSERGISSRSRFSLLSTTLLGGVAALMSSSSAFADCLATGIQPADVTLTCSGTFATTGTTNTTSSAGGTSTTSQTQNFNSNVIGNVQAGANISGNGLTIQSFKANGSVDMTNSGAIGASGGFTALALIGNGGNVSYIGSGTLTGSAGNSPGITMTNNVAGTGAVTFNATGGSITSSGGPSFGIDMLGLSTGGFSYTSSAGHTIFVGGTTAGNSHRAIEINNGGATGDTFVNSNSAITTSGNGNVFAFDITQQGTGNVNATQGAAVNLSGTASTGVLGSIIHNGATGNATFNLNGTFTGGAGGSQGMTIDFTNAASTGVGSFTVSNNATLNSGLFGISIGHSGAGGGAAETHQVAVTAGSSILAGTTSASQAVAVTGTGQSLNLTNGGTTSSIQGVAVSVASGFITGTNTGTITGTSGMTAGLAGSNFTNAGVITGTGGTAVSFTGTGNTFTLQNGSNITGNVIGGTAAANTLQFGGTTGAPSFNVAQIGAQYQQFNAINKIPALDIYRHQHLHQPDHGQWRYAERQRFDCNLDADDGECRRHARRQRHGGQYHDQWRYPGAGQFDRTADRFGQSDPDGSFQLPR
jgi:hypothetical protein